jgi:hypothetical protein
MYSSGRISEIRISAADAHADEAWVPCMAVDLIVKYALDEGGYEIDELPPKAAHFADLLEYYGQWVNGGHAQLTGNMGYDFEALRRASELLDHMGLTQYQDILDSFIDFTDENADFIDDLYEDGEEMAVINLTKVFDDRFHEAECNGRGLTTEIRDWLLGQPWLLIDKLAPECSMDWVRQSIARHPQAEERKAARLRLRIAESKGENLAFLAKLRERLTSKHKG